MRQHAALLLLISLAACAGPGSKPSAPSSAKAVNTGSASKPVFRGILGERTRSPNEGRYAVDQDYAPRADEIPADIAAIPDAVPRVEPRSVSGNSPIYEVFGKTYRVMDDGTGFKERGMASWYGKKFQGRATASGEPYDMYKMSAAHKSLPIPSYVRVTRRDTGRSVIVRINDRGPFKRGRIIDLSYAAAVKLDMLKTGTVPVDIVALEPVDTGVTRIARTPLTPQAQTLPSPSGAPPAPASGSRHSYWLQVAAYGDPINAVAMKERLALHDIRPVQMVSSQAHGQALHLIQVGPFADLQAAEDMRWRLQDIGLDSIIKAEQGG